ncbi:Glucose-6-phosphate isomerase [Novipirellula galeiformis]|uniref:Glucose-6-phosphate isomerase n=1 Tax=Novipirellula galeiformis TaxID=2528004 RepID=A0A5C6CVY1_9BACT|nr:glucose-6-phosphate isomerase [Novipirellula galeiformis]TWU26889.1 Glucose-6-phosphate isomerase [Novipirellula galeiformis]
MSRLRFDASRAVATDFGVAEERLARELDEFDSCRAEIIEAPFFRLPAQQLADYGAVREASEVGRIFKIANTIHDKIDAVVVLGSDSHAAGPVALRDACCDPYHNELTRGGRGSKPRMYFAGNYLDSDSIGALLNRLRGGGYGENAPESRWAMVVIDPCGQTRETSVVLPHFIAALEASLEGGGESSRASNGDYVIPITGKSGPLRSFATDIGCSEIYDLRDDIPASHSIFTAVGLMPAALLGLDCMKLLEGAVAMNEHFISAAPAQNVVLQYVCTNALLAQRCRVVNVWTEALQSVARWYTQLLDEPLGTTVMTTPSDLVRQTRSARSAASDSCCQPGTVVHHWATSAWRMDPLSSEPFRGGLVKSAQVEATEPPASGALPSEPDSRSTATIPQLLAERMGTTRDAVHQSGYPTTCFELPYIDTYTLGQLFQMLMIATAIETRCRKACPSGV